MLFPAHLIFTLLLGLALRVGDGFPLYPNENYYDQQIDEVPEPIPQEQSMLSSVYERVKAPLSRASGAIANAFPNIIGYPIRKPAPKHRLTQNRLSFKKEEPEEDDFVQPSFLKTDEEAPKLEYPILRLAEKNGKSFGSFSQTNKKKPEHRQLSLGLELDPKNITDLDSLSKYLLTFGPSTTRSPLSSKPFVHSIFEDKEYLFAPGQPVPVLQI